MNKYLRRGLWGVGIGVIIGAIFFVGMNYISHGIVNSGNFLIWIPLFLYMLGYLVVWPIAKFNGTFSVEMVFRFLLMFVYWFVLGILIGYLVEKITKYSDNNKIK